MKKLIAVALSGLLLVSSVPVLAEQPIDKLKVKPEVTTQATVDQVETTQPEKVKTTGQGQNGQPDKGTKPGTPVLGARRDAMASYNLLRRDQADVYNDEDLVTLAVIADVADLTLADLLARLTPVEGATLTIDQLIAELELDAEAIEAEAAEIDAKLAEAEEEATEEEATVGEDAATPETDETTTEDTTEPTDEETTEPTDETTTDETAPDGTEPTDPETTPAEGEEDVALQGNVTRYTAILEKDPDNRRIALKLARTYKELGQYDDAQAVTDKLLTVNAEDKLANIVAGQVMAAQGLYDGAIAKYRAALEVAAEPTTQVDLAEALDAAGQTTEAAATMEQAAEQTQDAETVKKAAKLQRKAGAKDVLVYVNGKRPTMDVPPMVKEGRTLIPFRALAQALNATVNWDETTKTVTMERDGHVVKLTLDSLTATIDGQPVNLDVPAQLHNNRTLVPVRLLAMALNADVVWDNETETVVVTPNEAEEETAVADQTNPEAETTLPTETAEQADDTPATDTTEAIATDDSAAATADEAEATEPTGTGA